MTQKINYRLEMEREIEKIRTQGRKPLLALHSCCAPCSSYVLEYLSKFFEITVFYYNPNIYPEEEYYKRAIAAGTEKAVEDMYKNAPSLKE